MVSAAGGGADVGSADRDAQDEPSIQIEVAPEEDSSPDPQTISYERKHTYIHTYIHTLVEL